MLADLLPHVKLQTKGSNALAHFARLLMQGAVKEKLSAGEKNTLFKCAPSPIHCGLSYLRQHKQLELQPV